MRVNIREGEPADIAQARRCFVQGDYGCVDAVIGRFLRDEAGRPGYDRALHLAAMNCFPAGAGSAGRDCALGYFRRLVSECPSSPLLPEAALWMSVLEDAARRDREAEALRRECAARMRTVRELQREMTECREERDSARRDIRRLSEETAVLRNKIKELEQVDVQFFQRKKDFGNGSE
jgi:hypothetical protein